MAIPDFPNYEVNCRKGIVRNTLTLRVKKPRLDKYGYPIVGLFENGKVHTKTVHRLIANAAFGYYNISTDGLDVCHLDEERFDARISNLALGSRKENSNFEKAKQRKSERQKGDKGYWFNKHLSAEVKKKISDAQKKPVAAYKDGILTLIFNSVKMARVYGFDSGAVSKCCNGKLRAHKGYQWRFIDTTTAMTV